MDEQEADNPCFNLFLGKDVALVISELRVLKSLWTLKENRSLSDICSAVW